MAELGRISNQRAAAYFTGGATAVLMGWRESTIDVDIRFEPEMDEVLRAIPNLKEELHINIEFASPADFIPVAPNWQERSTFVETHGSLSFFHFDLYPQALAKVERGHEQDLEDVREMIRRGLIEPARALTYYEEIQSNLFRFPAIDEHSFREAVEKQFGSSRD